MVILWRITVFENNHMGERTGLGFLIELAYHRYDTCCSNKCIMQKFCTSILIAERGRKALTNQVSVFIVLKLLTAYPNRFHEELINTCIGSLINMHTFQMYITSN